MSTKTKTKPFEFSWEPIEEEIVKLLDGLSINMAEYILSCAAHRCREKAIVNLTLEDYKKKGRRRNEAADRMENHKPPA